MSLGFRNFLNDRSVYDNQESYGHDQRNDLRNGERPPYCVKSADGSKDISSRYQDKQLTHDRYDHTEYSFSECLEYSSRNDTEPCDQIVDSYDTKCRDSDGKHIFGSTEQPQQCFRNKFKGKKTNECKTECDEHADFDSFKHTIIILLWKKRLRFMKVFQQIDYMEAKGLVLTCRTGIKIILESTN